jgi:methylenetetrahydrofolate dehydrogenase (NADP+)/methenyltetrahydrofolate cyclohydrolase
VAALIEGRQLAGESKGKVHRTIEAAITRGGHRPGLAVVKVGDEPASAVYIRGKPRACKEVGILSLGYDLSAATPEAELLALIDALNREARLPARQFRSNRINSVWPDPE